MATMKGGAGFVAALTTISRKLSKANTVRVGFLEGSTYPGGTPIAMIAAINEYGAPSRGQPPRPFFRNMIADNKDSWGPAIADLLKTTDYDVKKTLDLTGISIAGQLQQSIRDLWDPPLAPSTIARKGFDKPLIHTADMLNSVKHEVVDS